MKRLILIMLAVLTASAMAYKLPTAWTVGGGMSYDSVRVTIYRAGAIGSALTNVKDTTITGAGTGGTRTFYVDSLCQHVVRYMYFSSPDTSREYIYNVLPVDYTEYVRNTLKETIDSIYLVMDSLAANEWATAGTVTLSDADIDSIVAGVIAGTIAASGTGIYAVTMYARDTINNAFVPGINLTAVAGATYLYATTGSTGAATFNVDAATWTFNALGSPYTWVPFSRVVNANTTDTITGGGVTVVATASPGMCTVYGQIDRNGAAASGVWVDISLTRPDTLTIDSTYVELKTRVVTNASGVWSADVYYLTGDTRNFYYTYKDAYGRILYFRPTTTGSLNVKNISINKP